MLKIIKDSTLVPTPIVDLKLDPEPRQGSTDPVTSEGVKTAIDGAVGDASAALQEQIDDIAEKAGSGYIPKGEATVATLNALSGQDNGELYTMTDAGTLTDGSLAVVAGDTVAWDDTNSVWYKAMDYAPRQYGTNEVHNLPTTITAFRSGDYIAVDGTTPAKMTKDSLLQETAQNALAGNVALAFDPTRTNAKPYAIGDSVINKGSYYRFIASHYGAWNASHVVGGTYDELKDMSQSASFSIVGANITGINKYIFLPKGLKKIGITPTPNPWPTDTIGGDNPNILIIYAVSSDGTETALRSFPIGSTIPETIVASIPSSAVMLRFFVRANLNSVVDFDVVNMVESDVEVLGTRTAEAENCIGDLDNYIFGTDGSVDGKGATEVVSREIQVKGLSTVTVDYSSNGSWPTSQLSNNTLKFWLQAYASGAWSTIISAGKTSDLMKFVVDVPINATKIKFYTRCNTGTTLSYSVICEETATSFPIKGNGGTIVNKYIRVKPSTEYYLVADSSWDISGISSGSALLYIYAFDGVQDGERLFASQAPTIPKTKFRFVTPFNCDKIHIQFRAASGVVVNFNLCEHFKPFVNFDESQNLASLRRYNGDPLPCFVVMGDPHSDNNAYNNYKEISSETPIFSDGIIVVGDMADDYPTQAGTYDNYNDFVSSCSLPVFPVIGNHDVGSGYGLDHYCPLSTVVSNIMGKAIDKGFIPSNSNGYYTVEIGTAPWKVILIVLNNYNTEGVYDSANLWERVDYDSEAPAIAFSTSYNQGDVVNVGVWTDYSYKATTNITTPSSSPTSLNHNFPCWETRPDFSSIDAVQAQWLLDTMASAGANMGIVIVQHSSLATSCKKDLSSKFTQQNGPALNPSGVGDFLVEAVKAFEDKNASFSYTVKGETVSKDFSSRQTSAAFIGFVGGHEHHDYILRSETYPKYYEVVANKTKASYGGDKSDIFVPATMPSATVIVPNRERKSMNLAKIGVQMTQDGYKRDIDIVKQEVPANWS